jgi:hypothetical protein
MKIETSDLSQWAKKNSPEGEFGNNQELQATVMKPPEMDPRAVVWKSRSAEE